MAKAVTGFLGVGFVLLALFLFVIWHGQGFWATPSGCNLLGKSIGEVGYGIHRRVDGSQSKHCELWIVSKAGRHLVLAILENGDMTNDKSDSPSAMQTDAISTCTRSEKSLNPFVIKQDKHRMSVK